MSEKEWHFTIQNSPVWIFWPQSNSLYEGVNLLRSLKHMIGIHSGPYHIVCRYIEQFVKNCEFLLPCTCTCVCYTCCWRPVRMSPRSTLWKMFKIFSLFYKATTTPMCYCFVWLCCRQVCTFQCCCWKHANLRCSIHLAVYSSYLGKTSELLFCLCLLNVKRCDNSEVTCSNWQMLLILYCVECILCCAVFHYCGVQLTT